MLRTAPFSWSAAIVVALSLVVWLVWDLVVFCVTVMIVAEGGFDRGAWEFDSVLVAIPLITFAAAFIAFHSRHGTFVPASLFGRSVFGAQLVGTGVLLMAVLIPPFALRAYLKPSVTLVMHNETPYTALVLVGTDIKNGVCTDQEAVTSGAQRDVRFSFDGAECWGHNHPRTIEVFDALGDWTCDWLGTNRAIVITEDGPSCTQTSYSPGVLRQPPPLTPGQPVSPPPADHP